jgi:RNA polymerase sigma-70 factor (ECF subfamily)
MSPAPLEADYERWRQQRDLDALAAVFDAVAPELLRVARHLVREAPAAEDLVQTTFLAVLQQPQRFQPGARLVPWLVGILVKQAGKHRRAAARRVDPQRAAPGLEPAPDERLANHELTAAVQHALVQLREPYATVVKAHLQDGARPVDLAARFHCAPGTIRMQLSRGLAMLRSALPAGLAVPLVVGRAEAIARLRDTVLARAATLPTATAAPLGWLGVALMKQLFAVAALAVLGWCLWSAMQPPMPGSPDSGTGSARTASHLQTEPAAHSPAAPSAAAATTPAADDVPMATAERTAAAPAAGPGIWLVGTVHGRWQDSAAPIVIEVGCWGEAAKARTEADADGNYRIDLLPLLAPLAAAAPADPIPAGFGDGAVVAGSPRSPRGTHTLHVVASHELCMPRTKVPTIDLDGWQADQRREVREDFHLVAAAVLTGQVVTDTPQGCSIAWFARSRLARAIAEPDTVGDVDEHGRFTLRSEAAGDVELWFHHPEQPPVAVRTTAVLGQRIDVGTIRLEAPPSELRGHVEAPPELRANANLHLRRIAPPADTACHTTFQNLASLDGQLWQLGRATSTDADGAFVACGLTPGAWQLRLWSLDHMPLCPPDPGITIQVPAAGVRLGGDRVVLGVVVSGGHAPLANAVVCVTAGDESVTLTTDADGRARWFGTAVDYTIQAEHAGWAPVATRLSATEVRPGAEACLTLQPTAMASLELTIVDLAAKSERWVQLSLLDQAGKLHWEHQGTVPDGPWVFEHLPAGTFRLLLRPTQAGGFGPPAGHQPTATVERQLELRLGQRTQQHIVRPVVGRLRIEASFDLPPERATGSLELFGPGGSKVATTTVTTTADGWLEGPGRLDLRGSNVVRPDLPVGTYTLVAQCGPAGRRQCTVEVEAGETVTVTLVR